MMLEVHFMPYPHLYSCPLHTGDKIGVQALAYYFENLINDLENGMRRPAAVSRSFTKCKQRKPRPCKVVTAYLQNHVRIQNFTDYR